MKYLERWMGQWKSLNYVENYCACLTMRTQVLTILTHYSLLQYYLYAYVMLFCILHLDRQFPAAMIGLAAGEQKAASALH